MRRIEKKVGFDFDIGLYFRLNFAKRFPNLLREIFN